MSGQGVATPASQLPKALLTWVTGEKAVVDGDRAKIAAADENLKSVPLWDKALNRASELMKEHKAPMDLGRIRAAVMSVQSSTGNSSERLFLELGREIIAQRKTTENGDRLIAIRLDDDFSEAVKSLRAAKKSGKLGPCDQATVAAKFFVTEAYVKALVSNPKKSIRYPDTLSAFWTQSGETRVVLAEHKLTGDNDSKAIAKNLDALEEMRPLFQRDKQLAVTVMALPFTRTDKSLANKWTLPASHADHTACNAEVWPLVLGVSVSADEYSLYLNHLAEVAAQRIFQYVAPANLAVSLNGVVWTWGSTNPVVATTAPEAGTEDHSIGNPDNA